MSRSNYEIVSENDAEIILRDLGPWDQFMSVTNDIERIVTDLGSRLKIGMRLYYFDSEGDLTEVRLNDGKFAGFKPVGSDAA